MSFASLWLGNPITKIQELSLSSFVYYGHDITVFVYDNSLKMPPGVKVEDARSIYNEKELFTGPEGYSQFSDLFRYKMINDTQKTWVDADTICTSDKWNFKDNVYAGKELGEFGIETVVGGVLKLNSGSDILNYLIKESQSFNKEKIIWGEIGPLLVNKAFQKFNYMQYAYDPKIFCGISYKEWWKLWNPNFKNEILELEKVGNSISIYNQMVTRNNINKNELPNGSAIEYFYNKFVNIK